MPFEPSGSLTIEEFTALVERADLRVEAGEVERIKAAFETFREQLRHLHTAEVEGIEPAAVFRFPPASVQ